MELNGQEISVLTAAQMGYSINRVSDKIRLRILECHLL